MFKGRATRLKHHRKHMREVRQWHRKHGEEDWHLIKVLGSADIGYVYLWCGPHGSDARRTLTGTGHSALFLESIQDAMKTFRLTMAEEIGELANGERRPDYTV